MQKNVYGPPETATATTTMHVAHDGAQRFVQDVRDKLRHAPEELERVLSEAEHGFVREVRHIEERAQDVLSPGTPSTPTRHTNGNGHAKGNGHVSGTGRANGHGHGHGGNEDDNEGWTSDQSAHSSPEDPVAAAADVEAGARSGSGSRTRSQIGRAHV